MKKFLKFINGKKTSIATVCGLVLAFCQARGYLDPDVSVLIAGVLAALGISVNIANAKLTK